MILTIVLKTPMKIRREIDFGLGDLKPETYLALSTANSLYGKIGNVISLTNSFREVECSEPLVCWQQAAEQQLSQFPFGVFRGKRVS